MSGFVFAFVPNWIDYRASLVRADRREDNGETVPVCGCGCELDGAVVPHSPRCPAITPTAPRLTGRRFTDGGEEG